MFAIYLTQSIPISMLEFSHKDPDQLFEIYIYKFSDQYTETSHLNKKEVAYLSKISNPQRKLEYLQSRFWLKTHLNKYLKTNLFEISFETIGEGQPVLNPIHLQNTKLFFNLSHSKKYCAIAISQRHQIGVDIQEKVLPKNWQKIAQRVFSEKELAEILSNNDLFFKYWTAKEAAIKSIGSSIFKPKSHHSKEFFFDEIVPNFMVCVSLLLI